MTATFIAPSGYEPHPGSSAELARFAELQAALPPMFERVFPDRMAERTVVIVPSMTLDPDTLARISGVAHYEERMLCLLMLLRMPRTTVIYLTSSSLDPTTIDYYLHLLPGIPNHHAAQRLTLLDCADTSRRPLTQKILERPRLVQRIREEITDPATAHITCFNSSPLERTLAVQLGIPLYANDPALDHLGGKSGSRRVFRSVGVAMPDGTEGLRDRSDLVAALADLRRRNPALQRAVVKLDAGFSGEGNAMFPYHGSPDADASSAADLIRWIDSRLEERLDPIAADHSPERFLEKVGEMTAIAEEYIERAERSPSVQCRIDPLGKMEVLSTHEQHLDLRSGQIYQGCSFPANASYRLELQEIGRRVGAELASRGAMGRFGLDFVTERDDRGWRHRALEINLRKGGTTLPQLMLQFLTDGSYDDRDGTFRSRFGAPLYYEASDNVHSDTYRGLLPNDVIDIAVCNGLHFDQSTQSGTVFQLLGAVSEFGKLGLVSIAGSSEAARRIFDETVRTLDEAAD